MKNAREELQGLRGNIDGIDEELIGLFRERMRVSEEIARVKAVGNIAITDNTREREVLERAAAAGESYAEETLALMRTLMALSKRRQGKALSLPDPVSFPPSASGKKEGAKVAFQGVPGAWGEYGALRLFPGASLKECEYFDDVFEAVRVGAADYGVLPIENSQTGAIGEVYDLLRRHAGYIVGQMWITVAQCLLACKGAKPDDIREVFSHPEGLGQCRRFLKSRNWDLTACRNTAYAAQMVAEKNSPKYAAIGSRRAAEVHGLSVLAEDIMDSRSNRTRFIAIASRPIYDDKCDTTGVTFSTAHKSGALSAVLERFMLAGINLSRIESRPVSADKYRFFADLQANILADGTREALGQAAAQCDYFEILGCYPTSVEK